MSIDRADVAEALKGLKNNAERVDAVMALLQGGDPDVRWVASGSTRMPMRDVEAYGLTIELDAAGNALQVGFPEGWSIA